MLVPTLYLILSLFQPSVKTEEAVMVGKWKLSRKVPLKALIAVLLTTLLSMTIMNLNSSLKPLSLVLKKYIPIQEKSIVREMLILRWQWCGLLKRL